METKLQTDEPGIYLYYKENASIIKGEKNCSIVELEEMLIDALILSTDLYWKVVSSNTLKLQKNEGCIEIVFEKARTINVGALGMGNKEISRILLPIKGLCLKKNIDIYFADPKYGEFNVVINNNFQFKERVCKFLKECIGQ